MFSYYKTFFWDLGPLHLQVPLLSLFLAFLWFPSSNEVFGNRLHKVGRRHEDGDGADDVENAESHQTHAVDYGTRELPLVGRAGGLILVPEAVRHVTHLLQDGVQLGVSHPGSRAPSETSGPDCEAPAAGDGTGTACVHVRGGRGRGAPAHS